MKHVNRSYQSKFLGASALFVALVLVIPAVSAGRTDVTQKISQLKENADASQANLDQYEQGLRVVKSNLQVTENALKTIQLQKKAVSGQSNLAAKDAAAVQKAEREIEGQVRAERDLLVLEEQQIEDLKQALARLEANREKRLANIATYESRQQKVALDRSGSAERSQSIDGLSATLQSQEEEALAEKSRLLAKKADYEKEIEKWKKQVRLSQRSVANFSRLKPQ